jgi:hypothetical protein
MGDVTMLKIAKTHFDLSFKMLEKMIDQCPDDLWNEKKGGFVLWQQLLHAFIGINFWLRENNVKFIEPFSDKKVYPELDNDPVRFILKSCETCVACGVKYECVGKLFQCFPINFMIIIPIVH